MIKVSVIMPVYNSEKYIHTAIESILKQTLSEWELLLIDDGSTDSSLHICEKYAREDPRIKVFHHENHGISYTRNVGIRHAIGEYVAFIDNDDEYLEDLLDSAYRNAKENSCKVVKYGYRVVEDWHSNIQEGRVRTFRKSGKFDLNRSFEAKQFYMLKEDGFFNMIWNGLYENKFLKSSKLLFDEEVVKGYEDWIFNYQLLDMCENIYVMSDVKYIHYQRTSHSTSSNFHVNQIIGVTKAMKSEKKMFEKLKGKVKGELDWNNRAMEYLIEFLLLFERPKCEYSVKEECEYVRTFLEEEEMTGLGNKAVRKKFRMTQKMLSVLIHLKWISTIVYLSRIYNHYIVYKKKKR